MKFDYKENNENKRFSSKTKDTETVYPNEKHVFIMPNHEKDRDYYENLSLSHLMEKLRF